MRPGRAADHSPPSSAAVMEELSYTSTHPLGHTGPVTGSLYLYTRIYIYIYIYRVYTYISIVCVCVCMYIYIYMHVCSVRAVMSAGGCIEFKDLDFMALISVR